MTENLTEEFVAKVDAFAASLNAEEQAMLTVLLTGENEEVQGFSAGRDWPGLQTLGVWKAPAGLEVMSLDTDGGLKRPEQNQRIDLELK